MKTMRKIKRLPPILFPVWLVMFILDRAYRTIMWLFGFWYCKDCKQRFGITDERHLHVYTEEIFKRGKFFTKFKKKHICIVCKGNNPQE